MLAPGPHPAAALQVAAPGVDEQVSPPVAGAQPVSVAPEGLVTATEMVVFCGTCEVSVTVQVLLLGTGGGCIQDAVGGLGRLGNVARLLSGNACDDPPAGVMVTVRESVPPEDELTETCMLAPAVHPPAPLQVALPGVAEHVSPPVAGAQPATVAPEGEVTATAMVLFCASADVKLIVHVLVLGAGGGDVQAAVGAVIELG
jgi:hypothetical protein